SRYRLSPVRRAPTALCSIAARRLLPHVTFHAGPGGGRLRVRDEFRFFICICLCPSRYPRARWIGVAVVELLDRRVGVVEYGVQPAARPHAPAAWIRKHERPQRADVPVESIGDRLRLGTEGLIVAQLPGYAASCNPAQHAM